MSTNTSSTKIISTEDFLQDNVPEGGIFSKTLLKNEDCTQTLMQFGAGEELTEHTSRFAALLQFNKGSGTLTLGEEQTEIKPGLTVYMPPQLPHSISVSKPTTLILTLLRKTG